MIHRSGSRSERTPIELYPMQADGNMAARNLDAGPLPMGQQGRDLSIDIAFESHSDATRVDQRDPPMLTQHRNVGVSSSHDGGKVSCQQLVEHLRCSRRQEILHVRARRSVKEKQLLLYRQFDGEARNEPCNELQIVTAELAPAPLHGSNDGARVVVAVD